MTVFIGLAYSFCSVSFAVSCPKFTGRNTAYLETQNHDGHSSYSDEVITHKIEKIIKRYGINKNTSALDIGGGYGNTTYALMRENFHNIYLNDLDEDNLVCASRYLEKVFPQKYKSLTYVVGDITSNKVAQKLPNNQFGLTIIRNVLQFFTAEQINSLFLTLKKKMHQGGYLYVVVENGFPADQLHKIDNLMTAYNDSVKYLRHSKMEITKINNKWMEEYYPKYQCVMNDYDNFLEKNKRIFLFPCNLLAWRADRKDFTHVQILSPILLKEIIEEYGFQTIEFKIYKEDRHRPAYFTLIARKK